MSFMFKQFISLRHFKISSGYDSPGAYPDFFPNFPPDGD